MRIPSMRNQPCDCNEITVLDVFAILHDDLTQNRQLQSSTTRVCLCIPTTRLLREVRLVTKTSQYNLAVSERFQIEMWKEDANESTLVRHSFALRTFMWKKTYVSLTNKSAWPLREVASNCKHKHVNTSANYDTRRPRQPRTHAQALVLEIQNRTDEIEQVHLDPEGIVCVDHAISR